MSSFAKVTPVFAATLRNGEALKPRVTFHARHSIGQGHGSASAPNFDDIRGMNPQQFHLQHQCTPGAAHSGL